MKKNMLSITVILCGATLIVLSYLSGTNNASAGNGYDSGSNKQFKYEVYYNQDEFNARNMVEEISYYPDYNTYEKPLAGIAMYDYDKVEVETVAVKEEKKVEKKEKVEVVEEVKPVYSFSESEVKVLEKIVEAEATDQNEESKMNVASVIINRVESDEFPNTIKEVVFQKSQFSPIFDGRYNSLTVSESTKEAVSKVLLNGVTNSEALFFCNESDVKSSKNKKWFKSLTFLFKDDSGHSFYK